MPSTTPSFSSDAPSRIFLAVTGASGALYGTRTLGMLVAAGIQVDLCYSPAAERVLKEELGLCLGDGVEQFLQPGSSAGHVKIHSHEDIGAAPASGSSGVCGVVVAPCSLSTLSGIASGSASNLIERAAQVSLKEARPLVLVPRETPLSRTHLDQMSRLAWAGAVLLPACPGFYHQPRTIDDLVDHVCSKILGVLAIPQDGVPAWEGGTLATR